MGKKSKALESEQSSEDVVVQENTEENRGEVILRLKKVEGQIRGLQKMIEEGKECSEIINQLSAARKALDKAGFLIMTSKLKNCLENTETGSKGRDKALDEAMKLFLSLA